MYNTLLITVIGAVLLVLVAWRWRHFLLNLIQGAWQITAPIRGAVMNFIRFFGTKRAIPLYILLGILIAGYDFISWLGSTFFGLSVANTLWLVLLTLVTFGFAQFAAWRHKERLKERGKDPAKDFTESSVWYVLRALALVTWAFIVLTFFMTHLADLLWLWLQWGFLRGWAGEAIVLCLLLLTLAVMVSSYVKGNPKQLISLLMAVALYGGIKIYDHQQNPAAFIRSSWNGEEAGHLPWKWCLGWHGHREKVEEIKEVLLGMHLVGEGMESCVDHGVKFMKVDLSKQSHRAGLECARAVGNDLGEITLECDLSSEPNPVTFESRDEAAKEANRDAPLFNNLTWGRREVIPQKKGSGNLGHVVPGDRVEVVICSGAKTAIVDVEWGDTRIETGLVINSTSPVQITVNPALPDPFADGEAFFLMLPKSERPTDIAFARVGSGHSAAQLCPSGTSAAGAAATLSAGGTPTGWQQVAPPTRAEEDLDAGSIAPR